MSVVVVNDQILKKVQLILSEITGEESDTFTPDFDVLNDLNISPEELSQILLRINQDFDLSVPLRFDQLKRFETLAELTEYLEEEGT